MTLTPQFLDELRHRTSLSGLIGKTTKLQKAGREFRAPCPFHNEKTPSFYVNDDKGFYHCFGCGAHGDAIRWMTDNRGLPFIDAVKELAAAAGLDMPALDRRSAEKAERARGLHEAMADAATWFAEQLQGIAGAEARTVLERRGIRAETARAFGLGFAPDSRGKLKDALKAYGDPMLVEAGLLIGVEDKAPYDRFRGRLMIPIRDPRGRAIAFGGRIIGDGEPKYLNSPETPLFDKGRTLYNLDRALPAARKAGRIVAVEGYMDVIGLAQAGFDEVVAPLGTALTEHQLERLWGIADAPILCFDGDAAGQKAAMRAIARALPMMAPGRSLRVAQLPAGLDPDDIVRDRGPSAFAEVLDAAQPVHEHIWRYEIAGLGPDASPDERTAFYDRLKGHAAAITHVVLREQYEKAFHDRFYALFGPRSARFAVVGKAIAVAARDMRADLDYLFQRAVLLGLMRHTSVLREDYETVNDLPLVSRKLRDWRDRLVDLAVYANDLSENAVEEALAQPPIPITVRRDLTKDLAYSFYRSDADPVEARRDLRKVMEILIGEAEARAHVAAAEAAYRNEFSEKTTTDFQQASANARAERSRLSTWLEQLSDAA